MFLSKINPLRPYFAAALLCWTLGLHGGASAAPSKVDRDALSAGKPAMRFTPNRVCENGQNCQAAVLAEGWITANTLEQAKIQISSWPAKAPLIFNSDGGDLLAAMELGQWIRANQLNTRVGAIKPNKAANSAAANTVDLAPGRCLSACVLSFMGGVSRSVDAADVIGFHGLVLAKSISTTDPATSNAPTGDLEKAKAAMNAIGRYIESMGGDRRMVDFMLFAKGEQFQRIPLDAARQLGIDNQIERPLSAWRLQALDGGTLIALTSEKQSSGQLFITLALAKPIAGESANDSLRLIIFVKPIGRRFQAQELQEYFTDAVSVKILSRKNILRGKVIAPWKPNADGMQLILSLPSSMVEGLAQTLAFDLEIDFPNSFRGADQLTKFGTQGLKGALTALRK